MVLGPHALPRAGCQGLLLAACLQPSSRHIAALLCAPTFPSLKWEYSCSPGAHFSGCLWGGRETGCSGGLLRYLLR